MARVSRRTHKKGTGGRWVLKKGFRNKKGGGVVAAKAPAKRKAPAKKTARKSRRK